MEGLERNVCVRCGHALDAYEEEPVTPKKGKKGELCPECYRSLTPEEYKVYF